MTRLKKQLKGRHFSSDAEVIAAAETWLDGQPSEFFLSGLQKLEFGCCSLFPSWLGEGLISTPVQGRNKICTYMPHILKRCALCSKLLYTKSAKYTKLNMYSMIIVWNMCNIQFDV